MLRSTHGLALLILATLVAAGCETGPMMLGGRTDVRLRSQADEPLILTGRFNTSVYSMDEERGISFIVTDLSPEELVSGSFTEGQVMHVEMLWVPKPGATPIDKTATNASIRHIVFSGDDIGIYGGAGFLMPKGRLGARKVALSIEDATISLLESTEGFVDLLSPASISGNVIAELEPEETRRLYFNLCQRVTDRLGRSRFVRTTGPARLAWTH
ncbi:MAG: hypothetical protein ACYTGC_15490 [Planctomycetota bacterium]